MAVENNTSKHKHVGHFYVPNLIAYTITKESLFSQAIWFIIP